MMADETGRVFYANRATGKITSKPIGELLGKSFTDSLLEGKTLKTIESLFRQGRWSADFNRLQADGKRFSYQVTVFHLTNVDSPPSGYLVMARDITRERRGWEKFYQILRAWESEKAAQKSSQRIQQDNYEALLDSTAAGVFVENKKGLVLVNKTFTALTGHSADSLPSPSFLDLVVYKYKRKVGEYFDHVFQQRELSTPFREQCRLATKGGSQVEVSLTLAPLVFRHEVTVVGTILDASEVRDLQTKLINSERLVNTGKIAATIVHEFSRPLESVFTAIQSVKEDPLSRRQRDACRMVEDDLGHIKETMGHMISMYEFKHQKKSFVTLDEILRNTLDLLKKHLEKNSIKVQLNLSPYVSEVLVSPHQILQLFVALSQYSLSSMPSGGRLAVSSQKRGRTVIVIFEDTGIGMPEKELKRLFDPFYSWQDGDNWELGLHAAYDIVRQHNGEIKAGSTLGKGTRFVITLPVSS
jgi:PAS domain S-box-containing protein